MRVGVLEFSQNPADTPVHFVRKDIAETFLYHRLHNGKPACVRINDVLIKIAVKLKFSQLKSLLAPRFHSAKWEPTNTRWDWAESILATYPVHDQTSYQYGAS